MSDIQDAQTDFNTMYRFEPSSYGDIGNFMPSLACLKLMPNGEWVYQFVMTKPESIYPEEEQAISEAKTDIAMAYKEKHIRGTDEQLAMELKKIGYLDVENVDVVDASEIQA
jgi:hypothetical protein